MASDLVTGDSIANLTGVPGNEYPAVKVSNWGLRNPQFDNSYMPRVKPVHWLGPGVSQCSWCRKLAVWSQTGWTGSDSSRRPVS